MIVCLPKEKRHVLAMYSEDLFEDGDAICGDVGDVVAEFLASLGAWTR